MSLGDVNDNRLAAGNAGADTEMVPGHIIFERFLVLEDISDPVLGGRATACKVKDIKHFCREAILKVVDDIPGSRVSGTDGPSFPEVCEALMKLGHAGVESIFETGRLYDGRPFALAQLCRGKTLADVLTEGKRFTLPEIARLAGDVSEAIAAAHSNGLLHCDLRPANILVPEGESGQYRVINFGFAWPVDVRGERLNNLAPGSEPTYYAAPELLSKLGHRSPASDIYSLAVLAYRLITGQLPFRGESHTEQLDLISSALSQMPTDLRTDLSFETEDLIKAALRFEPAWRPQEIGGFGERLSRSMRPAPAIPVPVLAPKAPVPEVIETGHSLETAPDDPKDGVSDAMSESILFASFIEESPAPVLRRSSISDRSIAWALIVMLIAGALSIPIGQTLLAGEKDKAPPNTMLERPREERRPKQLRLAVENMAGKKAGISLTADAAGHVYLFHETLENDGSTAFSRVALAGAPGLSTIEAGKTASFEFPDLNAANSKGLWIAFSNGPNSELEVIRDRASADTEQGRKLRHFLERNRNLRLNVEAGATAGETLLTGTGERIIYRFDPNDRR